MISFGAGDVFIIPPSTASDITPRKVGEVQEISFDISQEQKELYGSSRFPLMIATTQGKITGKCKQAKLQGGLIHALLSGSTYTTGGRIGVPYETMPSSATTYTVTNTTGFADAGVRDANGYDLEKTTGTASAGQYSVTAGGVYTFGTSGTYKVSYSYSDAANGKTMKFTNQTIGLAPTFELGLYNTAPDGKKMGIKLFAVTFSKLSMGFQITDFSMPDMDFAAAANSSGDVFEMYFPNAE